VSLLPQVFVILVVVPQTISAPIANTMTSVVLPILARMVVYVLMVALLMVLHGRIVAHVPLDILALIVKQRLMLAFPSLVSIWEPKADVLLDSPTLVVVLPTILLETAPLDFPLMHMIAAHSSPLKRIPLVNEEMVSVNSIGPTSNRQPP